MAKLILNITTVLIFKLSFNGVVKMLVQKHFVKAVISIKVLEVDTIFKELRLILAVLVV